MKNFISTAKGAAIFFCVIYTFGTFANSALYLWFGLATNPDVHGHNIVRAWVCLVITIVVTFISSVIKFFINKRKAVKNVNSE